MMGNISSYKCAGLNGTGIVQSNVKFNTEKLKTYDLQFLQETVENEVIQASQKYDVTNYMLIVL